MLFRLSAAVSITIALLFVPVPSLSAENPYAGKKLIQYGVDCPTPEFLREHIAEMEKEAAFDGVVISIVPKGQPRSISGIGTRAWSNVRFRPEEYEYAIEELLATKFTRFTDNFIQVGVTPGVGWFDPEWSAVAHNAACLARVAKQGGCKGIEFDTEPYGAPIWSYGALPPDARAAHSFEEYVAKVRERGKEFIRAVNAEYPDITILCLIGPSIAYEQWSGSGSLQGGFGLLYAFFDGMCEAATPGTIIVDGYEQSYYFRERELFQAGRKKILELTPDTISTNPKAYREHMRAGFGIWADRGSGALGWWPDDFSRNYHTPAGFREVLAYGLEASDRYVWVWGEKILWWDFNVPAPYREALALAKSGPGPGEPNPMKLD